MYPLSPLTRLGFHHLLPPPSLQCLRTLVKEASHPTLTLEVCQGLLKDAPPPLTEAEPHPLSVEGGGAGLEDGGLPVLAGYPDHPLCNRLSDSIAYWMVTG